MEHNYNIKSLEKKYEERKQEYQETLNQKIKLETNKENSINEFKRVFEQLDRHVKTSLGLNIEKPIEDMSLTELGEFESKLETQFKNLYAKLDNYLRTGQIDDDTMTLIELLNSGHKQEEGSGKAKQVDSNNLGNILGS